MGRHRREMLHNQVPILRWFDETLRDSGMTDCYLTTNAGLSSNTVQNWRVGCRPRVDLLDAALGVLGYKLAIIDNETGEVVGP